MKEQSLVNKTRGNLHANSGFQVFNPSQLFFSSDMDENVHLQALLNFHVTGINTNLRSSHGLDDGEIRRLMHVERRMHLDETIHAMERKVKGKGVIGKSTLSPSLSMMMKIGRNGELLT
ncbi:hypothetical protein ZOSMA_477G00150 [Zostera marina]|uniref:Uncharacterized protein n=1 Tax=Zostera marina TaxID=29655 RepID=A0A0K9P262_ZOSMR|nr:hypothetical protein ZOSMA_477G00150 [Zostera marina]